MRRLLFVVVPLLALALIGCAGGSLNREPDAPTVTPEPTPRAVPVSTGPGTVSATVNAVCNLTQLGAEIDIDYRATTSGNANLSRVRVLMSGKTVVDSGPILEPAYAGTTLAYAAPGSSHFVQVIAESEGRPAITARSMARCGPKPLGTTL